MTERVRVAILTCAGVLVLGTCVVLVVVLWRGESADYQQTLLYVATFTVPILTALLAAAGIRAELGTKLDEVHKNTNGRLTAITTENENLRRAVAWHERRLDDMVVRHAYADQPAHEDASRFAGPGDDDDRPTEPIPAIYWPAEPYEPVSYYLPRHSRSDDNKGSDDV